VIAVGERKVVPFTLVDLAEIIEMQVEEVLTSTLVGDKIRCYRGTIEIEE
jgi:hypothetical protein